MFMNILKKLSAVTLSLLMVFSISGCSDLSWAMKTENTTLPIGVYIFYMSSAYSEAYNQVPSDYLDVLDQKINDKEVPEFIKEKAMEYCKKTNRSRKRIRRTWFDFNRRRANSSCRINGCSMEAIWNYL